MMYVACVTVQVKSGMTEPFTEATLENARNTRNEPGNLRFDVLRAEEDTNRFFLYEVYREKKDFAAHQKTEHYLRWRETVVNMMAAPRIGLKHFSVFPGDGEW
jgi:autoinducer 2-degrading protein